MMCSNCKQRPSLAKRLCRVCYSYQWRTGQPRPPRLWQPKRRRDTDGSSSRDGHIISVRLYGEEWKQIKGTAEKHGVSVSDLIRELVLEAINA